MRERGLKHDNMLYDAEVRTVAPRAGAWIETARTDVTFAVKLSLPVRERGLKLRSHRYKLKGDGSLPVRERGLKRLDF